MASSYTTNYQLNQWAAADKVLREEFNQDNAKIDGALAAIQSAVAQEAAQRQQAVTAEAQARQAADLAEQQARETAVEAVAAVIPQIAFGTYTGNGAASQTISLAFTPTVVFVCRMDGGLYINSGSGHVYGGLALTGNPAYHDYNGTHPSVSIVTNGFTVYYQKIDSYSTISSNKEDTVFHYIAFG